MTGIRLTLAECENTPADIRRYVVANVVDHRIWFYGSYDTHTEAQKNAEILGGSYIVLERRNEE